MNKKIIIAVISITAIALIALVGLQVYWIRNAVNLREANFRRSVDEVMSNVVYKLERLETANRIKERMMERPAGSSFMNTMDSITYLFLKELDSIPWAEGIPDTALNFSGKNVRLEILRDSTGQIVKKLDTTFRSNDDQTPGRIASRVSVSPSVPRSAIENLNEQFNNLWKKSYMVSDVFEDMFSLGHRKPIEERMSIPFLDSLIKHELQMKGLDTDYRFGIYSTGRNKMVLKKDVQDESRLRNQGLTFRLYPSEIFMSPDYLVIHFPNQRRFLITQMSGMLLVSVVLLILIFLAYIFSVKTIIHQRKLSESKNDFINNMTHEFKTPISTVSLACEALTDNDIKKSEDLYSSYINVISEENKRLGALAEKILQTAIIEKGDLRLKRDMVNINQVIEEAIAINRMQVEIKDGEILTDLKATQTTLEADHDHLLNVINNLLDNANKYSPKKPSITIGTQNTPNELIISIEDNGIGISKSDQKKIFEKLYRVHTGNLHDVKGFGLGLSYVKFIVDKLDGKISIDSEINKGSVFKIILPFKK